MISDKKLASLAVGPTLEQEKVARHVIGGEDAIDSALQHLRDVADMAQELLQYRQSATHIYYEELDIGLIGKTPELLAEEFANDQLDYDEEKTIGVKVNSSFPDREMRVWLTGGEDREVHWEWV